MRSNRLQTCILLWPVVAWLAHSAGHAGPHDPESRAWTVHVDNDLFAFAERDRDYTAGLSFTIVDDRPRQLPRLPSRALDRVDGLTRAEKLHAARSEDMRVLAAGLQMFSPRDISAAEPAANDRPYANLTYAAASRVSHDPGSRVAHQTSLTLGMIGLPIVESLHRGVHSLLGGETPLGYAHQIADGGEPGFRYAFTRHRLLARGTSLGRPYSLRLGAGGSVGYLTETSAELEMRWGNADIRWWNAPVLSSDYAGHPSIPASSASNASNGIAMLLDAGVAVRLRVFNAFLQGQFRNSDVTYSQSQLRHLLWEAWIGVMAVVSDKLTVAYTIRHQSGEIRNGPAARNLTWASIVISRRFD